MPPPTTNEEGQAAYRPTSLDFINLPNPIEPYAGSQRHPLNGTPRLEKARLESNPSQDLFKLILENNNERPAKRQKTADNNPHLDLPKLPVRSGPKRPRIPPTLSGLHQPPPDAGLLPSISVDQPHTPPPRPREIAAQPLVPQPQEPVNRPEVAASPPLEAVANKAFRHRPERRTQRNKWSDEETDCLLKGVAKFGIGSWTKILNCEDYTFSGRTALDLKDRFRVVCPNQYKKPSSANKTLPDDEDISAATTSDTVSQPKETNKATPSDKVSSSKLEELGIQAPFEKIKRRSRTGYTPEEDKALLRGFRKHRNQWAVIRQDKVLSARKPTDLRDRFRTRYPDEYAKAGLASKSTKQSAMPKRMAGSASDTATRSESEIAARLSQTSAPTRDPAFAIPTKPPILNDLRSLNIKTTSSSLSASAATAMPPIITKDDSSNIKVTGSKRLPQPSLFSLDDVFLNDPFNPDDEDAESEPITLDRGILDWASADANKTSSTEPSRNSGIDPRMTLKLPKPHASLQTPAPVMHQPVSTNNTSLPSLSAMFPDASNSEQLELPSLNTWLGPLEAEGRSGGNTFPSLEDLFS